MKSPFICCLLFIISSVYLLAQNPLSKNITKETYTFAIKGKDTLRLDKYDIVNSQEDRPCIIFVFGGGFKGGDREDDFNITYLENLAKSGYVAVGIDYRLGLKNLDASQVTDITGIVGLLENAVTIAVEDLYDATRFIYDCAEEWNINKNQIIANGSSAGAVTVLQAEYMICNRDQLTNKLPEEFRYGGIIAFAGAIISHTNKLTWPALPAPIQLFHGDADRNVPYDKIEIMDKGMLGSNYIANELNEMQAPHYYYNVINAAHEIASDPMANNLDEIRSFITKFVINKKHLIINTDSRQIGKPDMKKDFELMDYIQTNYM